MKLYFTILIGTLLAFSMLLSCKKTKDNACITHTPAIVAKVSGPNTALVNQEIDLTVSYILTNGCGHFENLEAASKSNTTTITLKARYEGCVCTDILLGGQINYTFKSEQAGAFYLKFLQPDNTYLIDTINVY